MFVIVDSIKFIMIVLVFKLFRVKFKDTHNLFVACVMLKVSQSECHAAALIEPCVI